jgi:PTS system nitrogen regulatory IIA component
MTTGKVKDRGKAMACLLAREAKMSTGMQNGVAIPHGKTEVVDELVACFALKKEGVDFESLDGNPSNIFIMTLSPEYRTGPHIQFLAEIGKLLKERAHREEILKAGSKKEILDILTK